MIVTYVFDIFQWVLCLESVEGGKESLKVDETDLVLVGSKLVLEKKNN